MARYANPLPHRGDPSRIASIEAFVTELSNLRRAAAFGTGKARVSIDDIARGTGIPRSTVHVYVSGRVLPPEDALSTILSYLGCERAEILDWLSALEGLDAGLARRPEPPRPDAPAAPTTTPRPGVPRQLPPLSASFVGRRAELRALDANLASDDGLGRLVAVVGAGGIGKTTLVAHWAARHSDAYPDGTLYVDLRGFSGQDPVEGQRMLPRLLTALGHDPTGLPSDPEDLGDIYRSVLAGKRCLLILDNARSDQQIEVLLPDAGPSDIIVTSRDALRGLIVQHGAARLSIEPLPDEDARELFTGLGYAPDQIEAVLDLCAGHPLALQVARERSSVLGSLDALIEEVDHGDPLLDVFDAGGSGGGVRGVVSWSYLSLEPRTQRFFRALGVLAGPRISLDTVAAMTDASRVSSRRELETLAQSSLLTTLDAEHWARHDIVAALARERLHAEEDPETIRALRARVFGYFLALLDQAIESHDAIFLPWPDDVPRLALEVERHEAWRRVGDDEDTIFAVAVAVAVDGIMDGQTAALLAITERSLWAADEFRLPISPLATAVLELAEQSGDPVAEASLALRIGNYEARRGEVSRGRALLDRAVAIGEQIGRGDLLVAALNASGLAHTYAGEYELAEQTLTDALARIDPGQRYEHASVHLSLGILADIRMRPDDAERHYRRAAEASSDGTVPIPGLLALVNLINTEADAARPERVDELIEEYSRIPNALEPSRALAPFLLTKALWAARSGNIPLAEATLAQAKATVGDTERDPFLHLQVIQLQGEIALCDEGREEEALSFFEAAIERAIDQRLPFDRARLLTKRGRALERLGRLADARASYRESVELATSLGLSGGVLDEPADALTRIGDA